MEERVPIFRREKCPDGFGSDCYLFSGLNYMNHRKDQNSNAVDVGENERRLFLQILFRGHII